MSTSPVVTSTPYAAPLTENGKLSFTWLKWFQGVTTAVNAALNQIGQFVGEISPNAKVAGRSEAIGTTLQNITNTGEIAGFQYVVGSVPSGQIPAATSIAQGAVVLPTGALGNTLGSASLQPASAFDPAGAAAAAQTAAETYASNASNLSSGVAGIGVGGTGATSAGAALSALGAAPIASPAFSGTVTQPDATVLTAATTAVSATAGGASALPATPAGYLEVHINGTGYKIPYFAL